MFTFGENLIGKKLKTKFESDGSDAMTSFQIVTTLLGLIVMSRSMRNMKVSILRCTQKCISGFLSRDAMNILEAAYKFIEYYDVIKTIRLIESNMK